MHDLSRINEDFKCGYQEENIGRIRGNTRGKKDQKVRGPGDPSALNGTRRQPPKLMKVVWAH